MHAILPAPRFLLRAGAVLAALGSAFSCVAPRGENSHVGERLAALEKQVAALDAAAGKNNDVAGMEKRVADLERRYAAMEARRRTQGRNPRTSSAPAKPDPRKTAAAQRRARYTRMGQRVAKAAGLGGLNDEQLAKLAERDRQVSAEISALLGRAKRAGEKPDPTSVKRQVLERANERLKTFLTTEQTRKYIVWRQTQGPR